MSRLIVRLLAALLVAASATASDAVTHFASIAPTTLILEGSSNVAPWRCQATSVDVEMAVAAPIEKINAVIDHVEDGNIAMWMADPAQGSFPAPQFSMAVPVVAFRCGNPVMERDLRRALLAGRFPSIEFRFTDLRGAIEHDIDRNVYSATVTGELSMAGARKQIELRVVAERIARDRFRIQAVLPLRMTDFGVRPPSALFGMVKAHDDLIVRFDLILQVSS